jgi:hypothetical protein
MHAGTVLSVYATQYLCMHCSIYGAQLTEWQLYHESVHCQILLGWCSTCCSQSMPHSVYHSTDAYYCACTGKHVQRYAAGAAPQCRLSSAAVVRKRRLIAQQRLLVAAKQLISRACNVCLTVLCALSAHDKFLPAGARPWPHMQSCCLTGLARRCKCKQDNSALHCTAMLRADKRSATNCDTRGPCYTYVHFDIQSVKAVIALELLLGLALSAPLHTLHSCCRACVSALACRRRDMCVCFESA